MKKQFLYQIAMLAMAGMLMGCQKVDGNQKKEQGQSLEVVTEKYYESQVNEYAQYYMQKYPGSYVKVRSLPEEAEKREPELQKMRTEIMSGKGADVFILNADNEFYAERKEALFEDVKKSMQSGVFMRLDPYMEEDAYWEESSYKKEFLETGQYEGHQYILPITCQYSMMLGPEEGMMPKDSTLSDWIAYARASGNTELQYAVYSLSLLSGRWQQPTVDYETQQVVFQKELWRDFAEQMLDVEVRSWIQGWSEEPAAYSLESNFPIRGVSSDRECVYRAVPDILGKKMAAVRAYGAISMACEEKEAAYEFLMLFLNDCYVKGTKSSPYLQGMLGADEVPLQEDSFKEWIKSWGITEERQSEAILDSFRELEGAYFPMKADVNLYDRMIELFSAYAGRDGNPEEMTQRIYEIAEQAEKEYTMLVKE